MAGAENRSRDEKAHYLGRIIMSLVNQMKDTSLEIGRKRREFKKHPKDSHQWNSIDAEIKALGKHRTRLLKKLSTFETRRERVTSKAKPKPRAKPRRRPR